MLKHSVQIEYAVNILNIPEIYSGYLAFSSLKVI